MYNKIIFHKIKFSPRETVFRCTKPLRPAAYDTAHLTANCRTEYCYAAKLTLYKNRSRTKIVPRRETTSSQSTAMPKNGNQCQPFLFT